ncbi:MAG: ANTAR domain-containing protein [Lapillicoccus sp.]
MPQRALAKGVRSSLSVPLRSHDVSVGSLNLYATRAHAFDDPLDVAHATALAGQADAVLGVVLEQVRQAELTDQLRQALASRSTIDQATGVLIAQQGCTAAHAFGLLRTASQHRKVKLRQVAADVVTSVTGHAPEPTPFNDP